MALIVARRFDVRQARVRISARHPRGGPLLSGSDEDNKKRFSTCYIYKYCMYAKEWQLATKFLIRIINMDHKS